MSPCSPAAGPELAAERRRPPRAPGARRDRPSPRASARSSAAPRRPASPGRSPPWPRALRRHAQPALAREVHDRGHVAGARRQRRQRRAAGRRSGSRLGGRRPSRRRRGRRRGRRGRSEAGSGRVRRCVMRAMVRNPARGRSSARTRRWRSSRQPAAHRHRQPARQRAPGAGVPRRPARAPPASRSTLVGPDPERPNLVARLRGQGGRPGARAALARRHRRRRPGRLAPRPVVGRARRGLRVGPRRARHEVADRRRGRGGLLARARGLAPGARRPAGDLGLRRGGRRHRRRVAHDASGPTWRAATTCSTRAPASRSRVGDERFYAVSVGEKGVFRFTLTTDGAAGHASMPMIADNALLKLGPLLDALASRQPGWDVTPPARDLLAALGLDADPAAARGRAGASGRPTTRRRWRRCCA